MKFALLGLSMVIAAMLAWLGRFEVVTAGADQFPTAFVLDRWTGGVRVVRGPYIRGAVEVPPANPFDRLDKATPDKAPWERDWGKTPATP